MALEQATSVPASANPVDGETNGAVTAPPPLQSVDGVNADDGSRAPRLPRWTRQEILVLIQGKRVAESKVRRIRTAGGAAFGSGQTVEPKWASVSSYCRMHGVNRGPVQCRKRWSNLAGDYKKIKEWESQRRNDPSDSFWAMRNDLRRERKLPGFFDKEVYDILDSGTNQQVAVVSVTVAEADAEAPAPPSAAEEADETGAMFNSGRGATAEDGMFSDFEQEESGRSSEKEAQPPAPATVAKEAARASVGIPALPISGAAVDEKQPASNPDTGATSQEGRKRKRFTFDGDEETSLQNQLIDVLERNGKALSAHLEAQNTHFQLDREQRKNHSDSLVAVLNKLADALVRISEKL
ncbi:hypothetical protein TIFTF001_018537 [Ficus carica]|uniref:Myb-like domain-containing protein n=1 Tax=Ficus carica TaxID=3494 RepID=A0AA88A9X8_FICCA|nr:hypothetical protein TIFTF001_018537 [Ficus carica]